MTTGPSSNARITGGWPSLRVDEWPETRETLHMWTQIVGKVRLAKAPMINHWWQVPLYVAPRGLTTSTIPDGRRTFEVEFDFLGHELRIDLDTGDRRRVALEPQPVATFYGQTMTALHELGVDVTIDPRPVEVESTARFDRDHEHADSDMSLTTRSASGASSSRPTG